MLFPALLTTEASWHQMKCIYDIKYEKNYLALKVVQAEYQIFRICCWNTIVGVLNLRVSSLSKLLKVDFVALPIE